MALARRSFGGRPPRNTNHPQHARADGPAFSQQAGFFPSHTTNGSGPRNNGVPGNPWHNQNNRNRNFNPTSGGNFQGQRRGAFPRPNNNNEVCLLKPTGSGCMMLTPYQNFRPYQNLRPGTNNHNARTPYENQSRISRPNRNYGHNHYQSHHIPMGPAQHRPGQAYHQRPPYQRQGYNPMQGLQTMLEGNQHNSNQRWRGCPNGRNRQNQPRPLQTPPMVGFNQHTQCDVTITQGFPETGIDIDGDIEMTDAPPLEFDLIQLLKHGTLTVHSIAELMIQHAKSHG